MEGILPPTQLDLRASDLSSEWRRWRRAFTDYLLAINLIDGGAVVEKRKLALFRHIGGEDVREIYGQMEFTAANGEGIQVEIDEGTDGRKLEDVLARFQEYCNPRSGIVVSRFEFHKCSQLGESVDVYLMRLRRLAEGCDFGDQRDSLIRDKLLFGLDDNGLRERLMRESDRTLTLDYVIKAVRVNEVSKGVENTAMRAGAVNYVGTGKKIPTQRYPAAERIRCTKCGREHIPNRCPAFGTKCRKCGGKNHWQNMCKAGVRTAVNELQDGDQGDRDTSEVYFGEIFQINNVESGSWFANIQLDTDKTTQTIRFKLDTGASLSVCGPKHCTGTMRKTERKLYGPGRTPLNCLGVISCDMKAGDKCMAEDIYVIENQDTPLLSRKACESLELISVDDSRCEISSVEITEH